MPRPLAGVCGLRFGDVKKALTSVAVTDILMRTRHEKTSAMKAEVRFSVQRWRQRT